MADPYATVTPERQARIACARELRDRGLMQREIAVEMGLSRNTVGDLLSDPDNKKKRARRLAYGGACKTCGAVTDGSNGNGDAPDLCRSCAALAQHEDRYWNQERIIAALREFRERVGRNPTTTDVMVRHGAPAMERTLSSSRLAEIVALPTDLRLPIPWLVAREFGSWKAALTAAGLPQNATGGAAHRNSTRGVTVRRYVVFSKNGHGWVPRETVEARDPDDAIQRVADGEGIYVAVAEPNWQERSVAPKTVFAVVESA